MKKPHLFTKTQVLFTKAIIHTQNSLLNRNTDIEKYIQKQMDIKYAAILKSMEEQIDYTLKNLKE